MTNMFIFLYVEEENVWLQENMYALKHAWSQYPIEIFMEVQQNLKVAQNRQKGYADLKWTPREFNVWWWRISKGKVEEEFFEFGKVFQTGAMVLWTFWSVS